MLICLLYPLKLTSALIQTLYLKLRIINFNIFKYELFFKVSNKTLNKKTKNIFILTQK